MRLSKRNNRSYEFLLTCICSPRTGDCLRARASDFHGQNLEKQIHESVQETFKPPQRVQQPPNTTSSSVPGLIVNFKGLFGDV